MRLPFLYGTDGGESGIYSPAVYQYVYDGQGNIVQSIDITNGKCYNYEYEEGRIIRATESDITLSGEVVTAKAVVNTIRYDYDAEGQLTKKVITPASGSGQTIYYETGGENTVVKFTAGGRTVTSHSKTDSFGRKTFDELQLGTDFVSRQFVYHAGKVTQEHKDKEKVKSSATTQLVSQIILSNGTTLFYSYDAEERITSVMESCMVDGVPVTNTTRYTYDALGQLLTETVNGLVVNSMEYDNYGNIVKKNGKVYTYGDTAWKDLLTSYNGEAITYDAQGNPTTYLGHTLTWEKGRQLKKFVKSDGAVIDYAYNANGIRTGKTVNGVLHTYTLDGTKILRETWTENGTNCSIVPMYDNEDAVCGIQYNDVPYYFIKNLQGDVVAIVDKDAQTVAKYTYDAWGVCTITQDTTDCNIAAMNPYRYRGYYFDAEIGLYYLQSRYYDPEVGRFLNSDNVAILLSQNSRDSLNLWTYVYNCPVIFKDIMGYSATLTIAGGITVSLSTVLAYLALIAVGLVLFAIIFDRNFAKSLSAGITTVWNYGVNTVGYLSTVISEVVAVAKRSRQYSGNEDHHIVAHTDYRAKDSREILGNYGLNPWHRYNVVTIKKTLHKHLHTSAYHYAVYLYLKSLEIRGKNYSQRRAHILSGLIIIGALLKAASNAMW